MSAARVYLMADFGKGPRSLGTARPTIPSPGRDDRLYPGRPWRIADGWCGSTFQKSQMLEARAWWLVETESADAARRAIAAWSASGNKDGDWRSSLGARILASGGQR